MKDNRNLRESEKENNFRGTTKAGNCRAVADAKRGIIIAVANLAGSPD